MLGIHLPGTMVGVLPGYIHLSTPSRVHRRTLRGVPHRCCGTREGRLTALRRTLAELTFRHAGVTVRGCYRDTFHCWSRLRALCEECRLWAHRRGGERGGVRDGEGKRQ